MGTVENSKGDRDEYYDDDPIGKGNFPKIWILRNYQKGYRDDSGDVYFSEKILYEFSSKEREIRVLTMTQYADNFGKGNVVYTTPASFQPKWRPVTPESTSSVWHKTVCK